MAKQQPQEQKDLIVEPMEPDERKVKTQKFWEPKKWIYTSQGSNKDLIVTEATAADSFVYEKKVSTLSQDAAADWLISQKVVSAEDNSSLNLIKAHELGLTFPDKVSLIQIIKMNEGLTINPLDDRDAATSKYFEVHHEDSLTKVTLDCEDPPYNHRASDFDNTATALIEISKQNVVVDWEEFAISKVRLGQMELEKVPYFVSDVALRHFTQLINRTPKKKRLLKQ